MSKFVLWILLSLVVLGCVVGEPSTSEEISHASTWTEYAKKSYELYVEELTDYYSAHPGRLESDLSKLTTPEYELQVPPELLDTFNIDRTAIEAKIKANTERVMNGSEEAQAQADADEADQSHVQPQESYQDTVAVDAEDSHMEISQIGGRRGRSNRRWCPLVVVYGYRRLGRGGGGGGGGRRFVRRCPEPLFFRWEAGSSAPPFRTGFPSFLRWLMNMERGAEGRGRSPFALTLWGRRRGARRGFGRGRGSRSWSAEPI